MVSIYGRVTVFIHIQMTSSLVPQIFQGRTGPSICNTELHKGQVISVILHHIGCIFTFYLSPYLNSPYLLYR